MRRNGKSLLELNEKSLKKGRRASTCKGKKIKGESREYVHKKDKMCKSKGLEGYVPATCSAYGPRKGKCLKLKSKPSGEEKVKAVKRSQGSNEWITFVKRVKKESGRKLGEILSDSKVREEYKQLKSYSKIDTS